LCRKSFAIPANGVDGFQTCDTILNILALLENGKMVDIKDDAKEDTTEETKLNSSINGNYGKYIIFVHSCQP
jgi:hypothetical protein